jgi:hypothetical protein
VRQIGIAFFAGLTGFLAGAGLLALAFFTGRPAGEAARTLHNVLTLAALLLACGGGFLALCAGPVLLAGILTTPRTVKAESRKQ